ncbi:unnamed protein product, partial [Callosobruchus maculatus]
DIGFLEDINRAYGAANASLLKRWARVNTKLTNLRNRRIFRLQCRKLGIIPNRQRQHKHFNPVQRGTPWKENQQFQ